MNPICKQCGNREVEDARVSYATPVCYTCLPPPPRIPIIGPPFVKYAVCRLSKKPIGRDSMDNGLCDSDCPGYFAEPKPHWLWPNERDQ